MSNLGASASMVDKPRASATVLCLAMRNVFGPELENRLPGSVVHTYPEFARHGLERALPPISSVDGKMNAENNYRVHHS